MRMKILDLLLSVQFIRSEVCVIVGIVTNNWVFNPIKTFFIFLNKPFSVALLTFGFSDIFRSDGNGTVA